MAFSEYLNFNDILMYLVEKTDENYSKNFTLTTWPTIYYRFSVVKICSTDLVQNMFAICKYYGKVSKKL